MAYLDQADLADRVTLRILDSLSLVPLTVQVPLRGRFMLPAPDQRILVPIE